jgi:PAS domain S-box-containing protein
MRPINQSRRRFLLTGSALILSLALSLTIFVALRRLEDQNTQAAFHSAASGRLDALEINIRQTLDTIAALGGFFDASHEVERDEFARFTARLLEHQPTIQALAWIPQVPRNLRLAFEMAAQANGLPSFQFTDQSPQGEMGRAGQRPEYFPIFFVEPLKPSARALGFDLASDPARGEALRNARDSGRTTATDRVALVHGDGNQYGFLVFRPCYRGGIDPPDTAARRAALTGFVLGVFRMKDVMESKSSLSAAAAGLGLAVFDRDAPIGQKLLYPKNANFASMGDVPDRGNLETRAIQLAGRTWDVAAYPLPDAFVPARWSSWSILVAELIGVACSVTYFYLMLNRRQAIERTVAERTEEFHAAMKNLELVKKTAQKAETHYRKLLEVSADAILLGRNDVITMANEAARRLFHAGSAEELVGRKFTDLVAPGSIAAAEAISLSLISTELQVPQQEIQVCCGDTLVDVEITAASYLDEEGANVQSVIRDITQRKQAEQALRLSEARLRGITDSAHDAILMIDPKGCVSFWNPAAEAILGYKNQEAMGKDMHQLLMPDRYLDAQRAAYPEFQRTGRGNAIGKTVELAALRKGGREIAIDLSLSALFLNGEWHAIGIMRDITERKRAEQALRDSEEKFRQLAENIREVFFVLTPTADKTIYVSPAYEQIWGKSRDSVLQNQSAWQESVHPEDLEETQAWVTRRRAGEPVEAEYRIRTPDGQEKWIRSRSFPVRDSAGELTRIVGIAEEITDRKHYEQELIEARDLAEAANRAKSIFLATMSHELRTPLNAVLGFTELLELEMADRDIHYWDADVQKIRRAGTHLLSLISNVMDLSKIEAGKMELRPDRFDIGELVQEVAASIEPLAAKNRVTVDVVCEPALLYGDRVRVGQCLFNLAGNACKFTHDGSVRLEAKPEPGSEGAWYIVRVVDSGIGIPPEDLKKLFCDFTQLDTSEGRKYGGTGLGLAISRKLSRLMEGDITAESTPGQGSTFTLRLPMTGAPGGEVAGPAAMIPSNSSLETERVWA